MKVTVLRSAPAVNPLNRPVGRLFDDMLTPETEPARTWMPRTDVLEHADRFELLLDLPGVDKEHVSLEFEGGTLTVSGERPKPSNGGRTYYRCECATGPFSRSFEFPAPIDSEKIAARFENGVLRVEVPKAERARSFSISIQ